MPPTNPLDQKVTNPAPYVNPYYESAGKVIDDSQKGMLDAVAKGGQAGGKAYQAQIDAAGADRQQAVARAASSAALGYASDPSVALRSYDSRIGLLGDTKASNQAYFDALGAAGSSYFDKARSGLAAQQAMGINRAVAQETGIRGAIQLAQEEAAAKAQAELDKENRAEQRQINKENRAAARDAAKPPKFTADALLGLANRAQTEAKEQTKGAVDFGPGQQPGESIEDYIARLEGRAQGRRDMTSLANMPLADLASTIGESLGVDPVTIATLYSPSKQASTAKAQASTAKALKPEEKNNVAAAYARKYGPKGVTPQTAKSAINNHHFHEDRDWILKGADGMTQEEATAALRAFYIDGVDRPKGKGLHDGPWTAEYLILLGEFVPLLPKE